MRTVRVFISSTFLDFTLERNILHESVFPRVKELCRKHNCDFQAIDLRWGITEKDCRDYSTLDICLEELKQCQRITPRPNFLLLSGNRYGWRPLPRNIPSDLFHSLSGALDKEKRDILCSAYRLDENSIDGDHVFTQLPPGYSESMLFELLREAADSVERESSGGKTEKLGEDSKHLLFASATHHELLQRMALPDFEGAAICAVRTLKNVPENDIPYYYDTLPDGTIDRDALNESLKVGEAAASLCPNTLRYELDLAAAEKDPDRELNEFAEFVYGRMEKHILGELDKNEEDAALIDEIEYHRDRMEELSRYFRGRAGDLESAVGSILSSERNILLVTGETSCGKSAFMAKTAELILERGMNVCFRFVGLTGNSADISILTEDLEKEKAGMKGSGCVIFLDGADRAYNPASYFREALKTAEEDTRLVISVRQSFADEMKAYIPDCDILTLGRLSDSEITDIIDARLDANRRKLTADQKKRLVRVYELSANMHVLSILLKNSLRLRSFDETDTSDEAVKDLIGSVGRSNPNLPSKLTRNMRLYLAAARDGLSGSELLGALSLDREVLEEFLRGTLHIPPEYKEIITRFAEKNGIAGDRQSITDMLHSSNRITELLDELTGSEKERLLPYAYFSRALYDLMPALGEVMSQGQRVYIIEQGLPLELSETDEDTLREFHSRLADYFERTDNDEAGQLKYRSCMTDGRADDSRKVRELPYQYLKAERYDDLYGFLCGAQWLTFLYHKDRSEFFYLWHELENTGRYSAVTGYAPMIAEAEKVVSGGAAEAESCDGQVFEVLAALFGTQGGHQKEVELFTNANLILVESESEDRQLRIKAQKALLMMEEMRFTEALEFLEELKEKTEKTLTAGYCDFLYAYGVALYRVERYEEAKEIFREGLEIADKISSEPRVYSMMKFIASCEKVTGHAEAANKIYDVLEAAAEKNEDTEKIITINYERATSTFLYEKDFERAFRYMHKARSLAEKTGRRVWLLSIYDILLKLYWFTDVDAPTVKEIIKYSKKYIETWREVNPGQKFPVHVLVEYLLAEYMDGSTPEKLYMTETALLMQECGPVSEDDPLIAGHRDKSLLTLLYRKCMNCLPDELQRLIRGLPTETGVFVGAYDAGIEKYTGSMDDRGKEDFLTDQRICEEAADRMLGASPSSDKPADDITAVIHRLSLGSLWLYTGFDTVSRLGDCSVQRNLLKAHVKLTEDIREKFPKIMSPEETEKRTELVSEERQLYHELWKVFLKAFEQEPELIKSLYSDFRDMSKDEL